MHSYKQIVRLNLNFHSIQFQRFQWEKLIQEVTLMSKEIFLQLKTHRQDNQNINFLEFT